MTEVLLEGFCQGGNVVDPALIFFLREFAQMGTVAHIQKRLPMHRNDYPHMEMTTHEPQQPPMYGDNRPCMRMTTHIWKWLDATFIMDFGAHVSYPPLSLPPFLPSPNFPNSLSPPSP